jgi:membrane-associated HD superfamily phosphohydrolase
VRPSEYLHTDNPVILEKALKEKKQELLNAVNEANRSRGEKEWKKVEKAVETYNKVITRASAFNSDSERNTRVRNVPSRVNINQFSSLRPRSGR